ncbi:hypothetical protein DEU56DRAFT_842911 [Suillus clintonianus]|uniref:uncharacterized protein n=1 Tax=Suillus clintonianus TaxID=1904413 RepID=UPI001B878289|nr:uncharacterized protein DEU56DRAFT_842911 [Suillus clintonianus]KAG2112409.1 hypothetical protein DEU56DRAFT_842911 [Suillus clintonianus]
MAESLPPELWSHIFGLAADEDTIFYPGLPTSMTQSSWASSLVTDWQLRTPRDSINMVQRRSYATKKSIISTCKSWRRLGIEFLVRYLFFNDPSKLRSLTSLLTSNPSLGWWTRRLHITHFLYERGPSLDDFEAALTTVLTQTPNLEIFIVDWPLSRAFGPIADTLGTHCKNLRTAHWHVPAELLPKVIWALDALPLLVSLALEFDAPLKDSDTLTLGSAQDVKLHLPNLQQLILRGYSAEFIEQANGWTLPLLHSFSFDFGSKLEDVPDVLSFLSTHGTSLLFLDLYCIPALDIRTVLDLCPLLTAFSFNLDWKITPIDNTADGPIVLTNRPHEHIAHIGLHGLLFAFGVGLASAYATPDPLRSLLVQRTNDRNFAALTKASFPKLERVRVLSPTVLTDLDRANGPQGGGMERWERWAGMCEGMGIRLEDCTGALLGTLPQEYEEEDEEDEDELVEDNEYYHTDDEEPARPGGVGLSELRALLEECRKMSEEREDPPFGLAY